jgi:hypothetical protein
MKKDNKTKDFLECLVDFLSDPDGLTDEELSVELKQQGIDVAQLEERVTQIVEEGLAERRLAWQKQARAKLVEIERILHSNQIVKEPFDFKEKIKQILKGSYGKQALSYAEAYFRKKETLTEKDLEGLVEDLEHLNLLEKIEKERG